MAGSAATGEAEAGGSAAGRSGSGPDYNRGSMHDPAPRPSADHALTAYRAADLPTLPEGAAALEELFSFMAQAELRFESLRMRILDRQITAHGEESVEHEIWLRHTGLAK